MSENTPNQELHPDDDTMTENLGRILLRVEQTKEWAGVKVAAIKQRIAQAGGVPAPDVQELLDKIDAALGSATS